MAHAAAKFCYIFNAYVDCPTWKSPGFQKRKINQKFPPWRVTEFVAVERINVLYCIRDGTYESQWIRIFFPRLQKMSKMPLFQNSEELDSYD